METKIRRYDNVELKKVHDGDCFGVLVFGFMFILSMVCGIVTLINTFFILAIVFLGYVMICLNEINTIKILLEIRRQKINNANPFLRDK